MTSTQEWAWRYHKAGWSVFPCQQKHPLYGAFGQWGGKNGWVWERKPTDEEITDWWLEYPDAQIGLACGRLSGITVIDIDLKTDKAKYPDFILEPAEDLQARWCLSVSSQTGSGGRHVFCKYRDIQNSAKEVHPQIDIKSDRGYVILPPSLHESGRLYQWDPLLSWSEDNLQNLARFPDALYNAPKRAETKEWLSIVQGVGQGSRNVSAAKLIGKLLWQFTPTEAWTLTDAWNKTNNIPPLDQRELKNVFLSILKTHYAKSGVRVRA